LTYTSLEICAGAGGQALGLERAGFSPLLLIDDDPDAINTLTVNRPHWEAHCMDLREFRVEDHPLVKGVDLLSGGVPRTPYSVAGRQHGSSDGRDLLTVALDAVARVEPRAVLIENVYTLLSDRKFADTRGAVHAELAALGYVVEWRITDARDFGLPQRRPSAVLVALRPDDHGRFRWPEPEPPAPTTVGTALRASMKARGWPGADAWADAADDIAPTIVGGSRDRGGADLGPRRTKSAWSRLGVKASSLADAVPGADFVLIPGMGPNGWDGLPRLTIEQVAILQGIPADWRVCGLKTSRYRQIAQAFPPVVAEVFGRSIAAAFSGESA
jgi:DNA (cytosine-5)-methyltransferase 1